MADLTHYRYIDALRGFAFLGVLTCHVAADTHTLPDQLQNIAVSGQYGVQLFFLLSAVTLLRSVKLRSTNETFPVRNFFIRRFFRIAPLFWFGILLYFMLDGCSPRPDAPDGLRPWHFISTVLFIHGWTPTTINSVVPGGWSIADEMTFYLCLPFLASRITSLWNAICAFFLMLVTSVVLSIITGAVLRNVVSNNHLDLVSWFLIQWFPAQLPVFLLGFAVYYCLRNNAIMNFIKEPRRAIIMTLGIGYVFAALSNDSVGRLIPHYVYFSLILAGLILVLAARPFVLTVNRLTCALGTISFSCYITHFAALRISLYFFKREHFVFFPAQLTPLFEFCKIWLTTLVFTITASTVTYFLIEKNGIRIGSRIIQYCEAKNPSTTHKINV